MNLGGFFIEDGYEEIVVPAIWETNTWVKRSGEEIKSQMWEFKDKGERDVTLIPEVTAIVQELYDAVWKKTKPKPMKLFYVSRCYRYERPQEGRYREFTQFGVEILGPGDYEFEAKRTLQKVLNASGVGYEFDEDVTRGLAYYSRNGFEARCEILGAQKQVAGGGTYAQGCGWAIGVDRLLLAREKQNQQLSAG